MVLKPEFNVICTVNIINDQTNAEKILIGAYTHKWWGNLRMWTDTAVGLLRSELGKRDVIFIEESPKILKLSITHAKLFWGFTTVGCTINLRVETGDGYIVNLEETVESTELYDSCDSVVTKAVAAMFNDQNIWNYLATSMIEKDSDCDGVPDEKDECPGTPLGVKVDSKGCPLDTDRDGVPDHIDECPGTPLGVKVDSRGCPPDTDGDGVPDYIDKCPGTPLGVKVDSRGCPLDTDSDGVPDYKDECPGTPKGVKVDSRGCPLDTDGDGVLDTKDKCPGTPKGAKVDERGCWVIMDTLFDLDKYEIKPKYFHILNNVVSVLKRNPYMKIEIQGHTCNMGTAAYNKKLSDNRANSIMNYLIKKGIEGRRLSSKGYGLTRPKASNKTEADRILNRRVELHTHPYR
jgi:hypothetical protein